MENTIIHECSEPAKDIRETFNVRLKELFGIDTVSGLPMWRVAWGPAQYAKQFGTYRDFTDSGIFIREVTEVREVPKYSHLRPLYILELLMVVPMVHALEMPTQTLSYESIHPYMHAVNETYLPPNWEFTEWVIDCYYAAKGNKSLRKYVEDDTDVPVHLRGKEAKKKRVQKIYDYLYGNDTKTTDALMYGSGVAVPNKQFGDSEQKDKG